MPIKLVILALTLTTVVGQLVLRRAAHGLGAPTGLGGVPHFIGSAVMSPWVYVSVGVQILSYVLWLLLVGRQKLGVVTAGVGAGYFMLTPLSAWLIYGEVMSPLQWVGIVLVTFGVVCVGLGQL